jgi:hypothetical protein
MPKLLSSLRHNTKKNIRSLRYKVRPLHEVIPRVLITFPYYSQWESPELASKILDGSMKAEDDPRWRASGAKSKAEYDDWSWSACGLACTKMILAYSTGDVVPIVTLGKKALSYGCYDLPLMTSAGLRYGPYVTFVHKEFGWHASVRSPMIREDIIQALSKGSFVIASVNAAIRQPSSRPKSKGGHLVLVVGYDVSKKELYIHNPSGEVEKTQQAMPISFQDFEKFFAYRGIIIDVNN